MKAWLVLVVAAVLFFGCTGIPAGEAPDEAQIKADPEKAYAELNAKVLATENFKATYKMVLEAGLFGSIESDLEVVKSGEKTRIKSISEYMGMESETSTYFQGKKAVMCAETSLSGMNCAEIDYSGGIMEAQDFYNFNPKLYEGVEVEYLGKKEVQEKNCFEFRTTFDKKAVDELMRKESEARGETLPEEGMISKIEVTDCKEENTGLSLEYKMDIYGESAVKEEPTELMSYDIRLKSLELDTGEEEVRPEKGFAFIGMECTTKDAIMGVVGLKDYGKTEAQINAGEEAFTEEMPSLGFGEEKEFVLEFSREYLQLSVQVEVCIEGECAIQQCPVSDYGGWGELDECYGKGENECNADESCEAVYGPGECDLNGECTGDDVFQVCTPRWEEGETGDENSSE